MDPTYLHRQNGQGKEKEFSEKLHHKSLTQMLVKEQMVQTFGNVVNVSDIVQKFRERQKLVDILLLFTDKAILLFGQIHGKIRIW